MSLINHIKNNIKLGVDSTDEVLSGIRSNAIVQYGMSYGNDIIIRAFEFGVNNAYTAYAPSSYPNDGFLGDQQGIRVAATTDPVEPMLIKYPGYGKYLVRVIGSIPNVYMRTDAAPTTEVFPSAGDSLEITLQSKTYGNWSNRASVKFDYDGGLAPPASFDLTHINDGVYDNYATRIVFTYRSIGAVADRELVLLWEGQTQVNHTLIAL